jgi:hypothetical protein
MRHTDERFRVLSLAPARRGVAFACLEDRDRLVDWGTLQVRPWNLQRLHHRLNAHFEVLEPDIIVVPAELDFRRGKKARQTFIAIEEVAKQWEKDIKLVDERAPKEAPDGKSRYERAVATLGLVYEAHGIRPQPRRVSSGEDQRVEVLLCVLRALRLRSMT